MDEREFHPIANLFPLMEGDEFLHFAEDIKTNGLRHPVLIDADGTILDGRNRYRACCLVGIEPRYETWGGEGDLASLIIGLNIRRRHLTKGQCGIFAAGAIELFAAEARERQAAAGGDHKALMANLPEADEKGLARDKAGEAFGVSGRMVEYGCAVIAKGSHALKEAVRAGLAPLYSAALLTDLEPAEQDAILKRGRKALIKYAKHQTTQRQRENRAMRAAIASQDAPPLPEGKFHCLVVDPPWEMEKIEREERDSQVGFDYPTMSEAELLALPIPSLAAADCHLYLWTTHKHLTLALELTAAWGFRYECLMTWVKNVGFTPYSWMRSTEHVIFARRGKLDLLKLGRRLDFSAKVREHSRKPAVFYRLASEASPAPRLDMFSREAHAGFEAWGKEEGKFACERT